MFDSLSRRNFLVQSGASLAVLAVPKWPELATSADASVGKPEKLPPLAAATEKNNGEASTPLDPDKRVGFAIVGLGHLSLEQILPAIQQSKMCKVVALVSGDHAKAKRVATSYGVKEEALYSYQDFDRIKDNKEIDVVYIVLPNSMHKEYTLRAAKAGKDVLCEKPMATNAGEAEEMVAACKKAGVKLMIAYRQQYEPNNRWMQKLVREKTFGKVKIFEANNSQFQAGEKGGPQQWRHIKALAGGGALPDIGLYCLNAARFLSGEEPCEVTALQYSTPNDPRFKEVEETISWMMKFPSGLIAMSTASYGAHETKRYRFTAEQGWFGMEPAFAYRGLKSEVSYAMGSDIEHHENPGIEEKNQFALEMDHMADCVLHNKKPHSPGEEGLQDHRIMDAIYESARTGKPVPLKRFDAVDIFRNDTIG